MYFTDTPSLNSMEAMMIRPPCGVQRGGGKNRSPYKYTKKDCDCKFCLYYRKKTVALPRYALCLISGFPVVQPRFAKLSNPHFRRWNISRFKDGFQKYINERMMVL